MDKNDGAASLVRSDALLACPWCGEQPDIHKHFRDPLWQLLHRCRIMGPLHIDWTDKPETLVTRWNHRHANKSIGYRYYEIV